MKRNIVFFLVLGSLILAACQAPQPEPKPVRMLPSVTCTALDGGTIQGPALVLLSPYGPDPGYHYVYPGVKAEFRGPFVYLTGGSVEQLKAFYAEHKADYLAGCP